MSLFEREGFEAFVARLPHCFIVRQWGDASVAKAGTPETSKIFALLSQWSASGPALSFKCSDMSFSVLPELQGIRPAPYLARAKWVQVSPDADLDEDALRAYITQAHRLIFLKLPKATRNRLNAMKCIA